MILHHSHQQQLDICFQRSKFFIFDSQQQHSQHSLSHHTNNNINHNNSNYEHFPFYLLRDEVIHQWMESEDEDDDDDSASFDDIISLSSSSSSSTTPSFLSFSSLSSTKTSSTTSSTSSPFVRRNYHSKNKNNNKMRESIHHKQQQNQQVQQQRQQNQNICSSSTDFDSTTDDDDNDDENDDDDDNDDDDNDEFVNDPFLMNHSSDDDDDDDDESDDEKGEKFDIDEVDVNDDIDDDDLLLERIYKKYTTTTTTTTTTTLENDSDSENDNGSVNDKMNTSSSTTTTTSVKSGSSGSHNSHNSHSSSGSRRMKSLSSPTSISSISDAVSASSSSSSFTSLSSLSFTKRHQKKKKKKKKKRRNSSGNDDDDDDNDDDGDEKWMVPVVRHETKSHIASSIVLYLALRNSQYQYLFDEIKWRNSCLFAAATGLTEQLHSRKISKRVFNRVMNHLWRHDCSSCVLSNKLTVSPLASSSSSSSSSSHSNQHSNQHSSNQQHSVILSSSSQLPPYWRQYDLWYKGDELYLFMYQHWSLYDSLLHSQQMRAQVPLFLKLVNHNEFGQGDLRRRRTCIERFLAECGIPLNSAKCPFKDLSTDHKTLLYYGVEQYAERAGLGDPSRYIVKSFQRMYEQDPTISINSHDMVHCLQSMMERIYGEENSGDGSGGGMADDDGSSIGDMDHFSNALQMLRGDVKWIKKSIAGALTAQRILLRCSQIIESAQLPSFSDQLNIIDLESMNIRASRTPLRSMMKMNSSVMNDGRSASRSDDDYYLTVGTSTLCRLVRFITDTQPSFQHLPLLICVPVENSPYTWFVGMDPRSRLCSLSSFYQLFQRTAQFLSLEDGELVDVDFERQVIQVPSEHKSSFLIGIQCCLSSIIDNFHLE